MLVVTKVHDKTYIHDTKSIETSCSNNIKMRRKKL